MKFSTLASVVFGANVALAARWTQKRWERHAARLAGRRGSLRLPPTNSEGLEFETPVILNDSSHVEFSSNWAGAVLIGNGFRSVTGTFTVPTPSIPSGGSTRTEFAASAWVGIDGDTAQNSILQTGVDFFVEGGQIAFDAWYEWFPQFAVNFQGITIGAGDSITVTVTATSTTGGTAVITNNSRRTTVTHTFSGETRALQQLNAEWIVEDFSEGSSLVPFADFGTVTFTGASATGSAGTQGPSGATLLDIQQNGAILTSVSNSASSVTVSHT